MTASLPNLVFFFNEYGIYFFDVGLAITAYFLSRRRILQEKHVSALTQILVNFVYPALIFSTLTGYFRWNELRQAWDLPLYLALIMGSGMILGGALSRLNLFKTWPANQKRSFIFMMAMPNYVFIPLLITQNFWGPEATAYLILASFGGDFFLWLIAIPLLGSSKLMLTLIRKPPILAMALALVIIIIDKEPLFTAIAASYPLLQGIGWFTVPLSMIILGGHLGAQRFDRQVIHSQFFLSFIRLIITPAIVFALLLVFDTNSLKGQVLFLIATMPTAIASAILARLFGGDARYCAQQVFISHVLAIVTVPLWLYLRLVSLGGF